MKDEDALDARLTLLLAAPPSPPDDAFVARVRSAVLAERRIAAAEAATRRRFVVEGLATLAIAAAFLLLGRLAPLSSETGIGTPGPALAAVLLLALWYLVELRPAALER